MFGELQVFRVDNEPKFNLPLDSPMRKTRDVLRGIRRAVDIATDVTGKATKAVQGKIRDEVEGRGGYNQIKNDLVERVHDNLDVLKNGYDEGVVIVRVHVEETYSKTREGLKAYPVPKNTSELLKFTRIELAKISACIMQISTGKSENLAKQFGKAVLPTVTGVAATSALLSSVAALATASTGTAISTLAGAASSSATLAWIGGILGGGMAAGALMTGGLGVVVGLATYKVVKSEPRSFDTLSETERDIVKLSWLAIAFVDKHIESVPERFTKMDAEFLLVKFFQPLLEDLNKHKDAISKKLDETHGMILRVNIVADFNHVVMGGFNRFISDGLVDFV